MKKPVDIKTYQACMRAIQARRKQAIDSNLYLDTWLVVMAFGQEECVKMDMGTISLMQDDNRGRLWVTSASGDKTLFDTEFRYCHHENKELCSEARERGILIRPEWIKAYSKPISLATGKKRSMQKLSMHVKLKWNLIA